MTLGQNLGGSGSYSLSGGSLSCGLYEYIGVYGNGTFTQSGGSNSTTQLIVGGPSGNGTYSMGGSSLFSAASEYVGLTGTGTFTQSGGIHDVSYELYIGNSVGSSGTFTLSGTGQLSTPNEFIGYYGSGSFTQSGGTHSVGTLILGFFANSSGIYNLNGGLLSVATISGSAGIATFNFGGGTLGAVTSWSSSLSMNMSGVGGPGTIDTTSGNINLTGNLTGPGGLTKIGPGTLTLTGVNTYSGNTTVEGGTLELAGGQLSSPVQYVGNSGIGTFSQSAGTNTLTGSGVLYVGNVSGASGAYNLSGGSLAAPTVYLGKAGTGSLTQTAGTCSVPSSLYLAYNPGSNGAYSLSGSGVLSAATEYVGGQGTGNFAHLGGANSVSTELYVGYDAGSSGGYSLSGSGLLSAPIEYIGVDGNGIFAQSGGANSVSNILAIGGLGGSGTYSLTGNSVLSVATEFVGNYGPGSVTQLGGTHSVASLILAENAGSTGTYNLDSGLLNVAAISGGSGNAAFNFGGGTLGALAAWSSSLNMNMSFIGGPGTIDTTGGNITLTGVLSGFGGLTKVGTGTLVLSGSNVFSGGTTINVGLVQVDNSSALGANVGALNVNGGTLDLHGYSANVGAVSGTGDIDNLAPSSVSTLTVGNGGATSTFAGSIRSDGGIVALAKVGGGAVTLAGNNLYTGATTVSGGTLVIGPTGSIAPASAVSVTNDSTLLLTAPANLPGNAIIIAPGSLLDTTAAGSFSLTGSLTIGRSSGAGTDLNGNLVLNGGTINIAGSSTAGTLTEAGNLSLNGGALLFDLDSMGASDLVKVNNLNLNAMTAISINMLGGSLSNGSYDLIRYSGSLTGNTSILALSGAASGVARQAFTLVTSNSSAGMLLLEVTGAPSANLVWTGLQNAIWDTAILNWNNNGTADRFYNGDTVTFDDTADTASVTLNMNVQPQNVFFNNNSLNYILAGTGGVSGTGSLTKNGSGTLVVSVSDSYTGGTTISGGLLQANNNFALGAASSAWRSTEEPSTYTAAT